MTQSAVFRRDPIKVSPYDQVMDGITHGSWSYVRKDDEGMHGAVRRLAENLIAEYEILTGGKELDLFFDRVSLKWGDDWRSQIRKSLEATTFFIPIITPRYFASKECRNELLSFASQAEELGLKGLIMPIYFAEVAGLEDEPDDPAMKLISERNREDWRNLRLLDETVQPYRVAVNRLATELLEMTRDRESAAQFPPKVRGDAEADTDRPSTGATPTQASEQSTISEEQQEPGIMELLAEGEDAFPRIAETLGAINIEIELVGTLARSATEEIKKGDSEGKGFRGRLAVMNRLAKSLTEPADQLEALTSRYAADLLVVDPAIRHLIRLIHETPQDDPEGVEEFFGMVRGMVKASGGAAVGIEELIASFEVPANFSRELDVPLRRMRVSFQSMVDGNQMIESWQTFLDAPEAI